MMYVDFTCEEEYCTELTVDTNGGKTPNQPGKDIFKFTITPEAIIPQGERDICYGYDCGMYTLSYHKIFDGIPYCKEYEKSGKCHLCEDKYELKNGKCKEVDLANCEEYTQDKCSKCEENFLLTDGECQSFEAMNCLATEDGVLCSDCKDGYKNVDGFCNKLNIKNCIAYNKDVCIACADGTNLDEGACYAPIEHCLSQEKDICNRCENHYENVGIACEYINVSNCVSYEEGRCTQCWNSEVYRLNPQVNTCTRVDGLCKSYDYKGACTECACDFENNTYNCMEVDANGKCARCNEDKVILTNNGRCRYYTKGCIAYDDDGNCLACANGYRTLPQRSSGSNGYIYSDTLVACHEYIPHCITYYEDGYSDGCVTCDPGYRRTGLIAGYCIIDTTCISFNGDCCTQCAQGYELGTCKCSIKRIDNCYRQNGLTCEQCNSYYYLHNNECLRIPNCRVAATEGCISCESGYYLVNGFCNANKPHCTGYSGDNCTSCETGYIVSGANCIEKYPGAVYVSGINKLVWKSTLKTIQYRASYECDKMGMYLPDINEVISLYSYRNSLGINDTYWASNYTYNDSHNKMGYVFEFHNNRTRTRDADSQYYFLCFGNP